MNNLKFENQKYISGLCSIKFKYIIKLLIDNSIDKKISNSIIYKIRLLSFLKRVELKFVDIVDRFLFVKFWHGKYTVANLYRLSNN